MLPRQIIIFALLLPALLSPGCGDQPAPAPEQLSRRQVETPSETAESDSTAIGVAILGDSLAAGLGLAADEAFPALLERMLIAEGLDVEILNAGVSGDTSAGGRSRLSWLLRQEPEVLVVELGANDGLRGLSPAMTAENLRQIVVEARGRGIRVLLLGMRLPPNYGEEYVREFEAVYPRLAAELGVPLMPFLLESVAGRPELNLADGIHPNARGQRLVAESVLPFLRPLLEEVGEEP